jgi:hypothetical protein
MAKSLFNCIADGGELIVYSLLSETEAILPTIHQRKQEIRKEGM